MTVKVIVEFQAKPGRRPAFLRLMQDVGEKFGPIMKERGARGFALFEPLDNPDMVVEIAEWETSEAREALFAEALASGAFAPMMELLAKPPTATYLRPLA